MLSINISCILIEYKSRLLNRINGGIAVSKVVTMANQENLEKQDSVDFESQRSTADNSTGLESLEMIALGASEEIDTAGNQGENTHKSPVVSNGMTQEVQQFSTSTTVITDIGGRSFLNSPFPVRGVVVINDEEEQFHAVEAESSELTEPAQEHSDPVTEVEAAQGNVSCTEVNATTTAETTLAATVMTNDQLTQSIEPSYVVIEQVALEQLNQLIAASQNTAAVIEENVTLTNPVVEPTTASQSNSPQCFSTEDSSATATTSVEEPETKDAEQEESGVDQEFVSLDDIDDDTELDTKALASQLTAELKRYSIPQAVFAKKVLHRSQGTLSDILRKPKPWSELKGGREIFKRMKQWLDLPEVKRIPQLRTEAAKELDSTRIRRNVEEETVEPPTKKARRQFTDSQKRALFAIFKETKKPSKEMQIALAEELGLERSTVSNFFMNARRRHTEA